MTHPISPDNTWADNKWALIIGINDYLSFPALQGCVNDAKLMVNVLENDYSFPPQRITLLLNAEATQQSILSRFDSLLHQVTPDGVALIYFSGHAQQLSAARNGAEGAATLVAYDFQLSDSNLAE